MTTVETLEKLERRVTVTLSKDEIDSEVEKQLKIRARTTRAPGFRKGKVPMKMVAAQFGAEIRGSVLQNKILDAFNSVVRENNLSVAGYPRIEAKGDLSQDNPQFNVIFEVYPEITIGDLSALEIEKVHTTVGDAEVDKTIDTLRRNQAHYHPRGVSNEHGDGGTDTSAQKGDMLTIDYEGRIDGKPFDGGKADDYAFVLGEGHMLPEFEEAALGMKKGETKTFTLKFPDDYHGKDVAGKTAEFTITIKEVEWSHLPEVNEDFIKALGVKSGDLKSFREEIHDNLVRESDARVKMTNKENVMNALEKAVSFDIPKALIEQEVQQLVQNARDGMKQRGQDPSKVNFPPDLFNAQAEKRVRMGLILGKIIDEQKIKADADKVRAQIESIAKSYQDPKMIVDYYYGDKNRLNEMESLVIEENVVDYVLSKAKVSEKEVPLAELMKFRMPTM